MVHEGCCGLLAPLYTAGSVGYFRTVLSPAFLNRLVFAVIHGNCHDLAERQADAGSNRIFEPSVYFLGLR